MTAARAPQIRAPRIERVAWDPFYNFLRRNIKAGEHAVIIGMNGSGKSVLAQKVVPLFGRNIVAIDGKGGDDPSVNQLGFRLIRTWPPSEERFGLMRVLSGRESEPIRVQLAPKKEKMMDLARNRLIFASALDDLFTRKGRKVFAIYIDELGELADPKKMGLGPKVEVLLQQLRYKGGSIVTAMQWPTWLPKPAYRETTHRFVFRAIDEEDQKYLASIMGNRKEAVPVMRSLQRHEFIYQNIHKDIFVVSKVKR